MRKTFFAGLAFAALSTSAFAADMPAYPQEAATVSGFSWSGAYVGVHGGWGWGESDGDNAIIDDIDGFVIGGHVGYNFQWDSFVLGLEGDASFTDQNSDITDGSVEGDYIASIRGRLGFAVDRFLVYGTGGVAFTGATVIADGFGEDDATYFGWVAGGGVEYAITDNITFGVEYLHYEFDGEEFEIAPIPAFETDLTNDVVRGRLNVKFDGLFN